MSKCNQKKINGTRYIKYKILLCMLNIIYYHNHTVFGVIFLGIARSLQIN